MLAKTGGFACNWLLALAASRIELYPNGRQSHINCTQVATSPMQIVPALPPVVSNINKIDQSLHATGGHAGTICMRLAATRVQFACDWRPLDYMTRDKQSRGV